MVLLLLIYAALSKLGDYRKFVSVLNMSPLIKGYGAVLGLLIPSVELLIGLLLFIPATRLTGLYLSILLLLAFTLYLIYMVVFAPDLPCSCGGVLKELSWPQHIVLNIFFLAGSVAALFLYKGIRKGRNNGPP
jgi:hypothetical protein